MSKIYYCPKCGEDNFYINGEKPNFCTGCRLSFKASANQGKPVGLPNEKKKFEFALEDDAEEAFSSKGFKFELGVLEKDTLERQSLGSLAMSSDKVASSEGRVKDEKLSKAAFFKKFSEEGGGNSDKR